MKRTCSWLVSFLQGCFKELLKPLSTGSAVEIVVCLLHNGTLQLYLLSLLQQRPEASRYLPQHE